MSCIEPVADAFPIEQLEKAHGYDVVVENATLAHAAYQVVNFHECLRVMTAKLAALIGMHGDGFLRLTPPYRHQKGIERQFPLNSQRHRPAFGLPGI